MISDGELHHKISALLAGADHPSAEFPITNETPLVDGGLELTSLDLVRLFVGLEEELQIELEDTAMFEVNFDRVDDIVMVVRSSLAQQRTALSG